MNENLKAIVLGLSFVVYTVIVTVALATLGTAQGLIVAVLSGFGYMALLGGLLDPKGRRK